MTRCTYVLRPAVYAAQIVCSSRCALHPVLTDAVQYRKADIALGHEGVGVVEELGPEVKYLKKGDRVGWGYEHDSCGHCEQCLKGAETYCPERAMYGKFDSVASHYITPDRSSASRYRPGLVCYRSCLA